MGLTAILCATVFRIFAMGIPEQILARLQSSDPAPFLIYTETGRDVRFSSSVGTFSPRFVETPLPAAVFAEEAILPVFLGTEEIAVQNTASVSVQLDTLLAQPLTWNLTGREPKVLILHTHSTESYTRSAEDYTETAAYRTLDEAYNMLSIGEEVARLLREAGICVIQDGQIHDYPSYNGSYAHARKAIGEILAQYPSIALILDLHRDASEGSGGQMRTAALVDGEPAAQLMVVLGANHDRYPENLGLGLKLHAQLERMHPGITRPLQLRGQRFNQDLHPGALLVEVGAAGNTHSEALAAARALAQGVISLANGTGTG